VGRRLSLRLRQSRIPLRPLAGLLLLFAAAGCDDDAESGPYLQIAGGGFVFNYRLAEAHYGLVVHVKRTLPDGAVLEAAFENPADGSAIVVRQPARPGRKGYKFETPTLRGIRAGRDYRAEVRLLADAGGAELERHERAYRSDLDQTALPDRPLTSGPGYHPPPPPPGGGQGGG